MIMTRQFLLTTAFVALSTTPALADLTAQDVWAEWQAIAANSGYTLMAGEQSQSGDTLTVSGVTMSMVLPEGTMIGQLGDIAFTERGDGTVAVELPEEYPLVFSGTDTDGAEFVTTLTLTHDGLEMTASGAPGRTLHSYGAASIGISGDAFETDDEVIPMDLELTIAQVAGEYEVVAGTPMAVRSDLTAGAVAVGFAASDPEGSGNDARLTATLSDLVSTSNGTMSSFSAMAGLAEMIGQGLSSEAQLSYRDASYQISGTSEGETFQLVATAAQGELAVSVGENGVSYSGRNQDMTLVAAGSQMPLPDLNLAMDSSSWKFDMPLTVSEEPQDFAILLRFDGLTASDAIWSMFDPAGALPRDPATLVVDLGGTGRWFVDITDPALAETPLEGAPGEVQSLSVNEVRLGMAGAELTGAGDFTFDNATMPPVPVGAIDLRLVGGNGLIDRLVSMGALPQEQAMGARMMLGLFARPDGDDTLTSRIEFTPQGGIIANGQPLR
jgi:hypothetical protein